MKENWTIRRNLPIIIYYMIPGSKGQKADASLLARGFLTS
ncbi:hypothetical protein COPCOM_01948 [Coprococcus comes ATCC 27758]|uniref:Uncharacterized protein n=1 Tax=Coprococcus comes ATCC 27758 TaxID=470146 RepID=C0B9X0_9FIRM|nr:hypothetical protein COPCOM_01948 [Coprococcus comes ATCC 27758]